MANDKKGPAKALFMAGYTQQHIATVLKLSPNTIGKWSADGNWKTERVKRAMIEENSLTKLMEIFQYQIDCLHIEMQDRKDNEKPQPFANGKFDALQKLFSTIKPDWQKFKLYANVLKEFLNYCQQHDLELAKKIMPIGDMFLHEKQSTL